MASVLFLAPADLGETVLATGALDFAMTRTQARSVTVVCDPWALNLFIGLPGLDGLFERRADVGAWAGLAWRIATRPFDLAIDFGPPGLYPLRVGRRVHAEPGAVVQHLTELYSNAVGAERVCAPRLWLHDHARQAAAEALPMGDGPLLVIAPGGVTADKRWPAERFGAVARRLATGPLAGARVVLLGAAARDMEVTRSVARSLDADGVAAIDLGRSLALNSAAALMERATLCIGNDNALTHIAAAMGAPTLTLFGPTDERVRAPYGPRARTLRGRSLEEFAAARTLDGDAAMGDIGIDAVEAAALELLHAGGLR